MGKQRTVDADPTIWYLLQMITTESQRRALGFVLAANQGGYHPQSAEVREWLERPDPLPGKPGKLIRPAVPAKKGTSPRWTVPSFGSSMDSTMEKLVRDSQAIYSMPAIEFVNTFNRDFSSAIGIASIFGGGTPPRPAISAKYAPDGAPEHVIKLLLRLQWLQKNSSKGLSLTPLGRALFASDSNEEAGIDDSGIMMLEAHNPLSWGRLIGHISELEDVFVIDPYLRDEQLLHLKQHTDTRRALVGPALKTAEVTQLRVLLATPGYEGVEVRQAPIHTLHDRYVISSVSVHLLGASMNGVGGATTTIMVPLPDDHAALIRELAEEWWNKSADLRSTPEP